jgi:uncharacterized alpha-E superfamily protein
VFEMQLLVRCLNAAGILDGEDATVTSGTMLASAALRTFRNRGGMRLQLGRVNGQVGQLRDRLTEELYAVLTHSLRDLGDAMRHLPPDSDARVLEQGIHLTVRILEFAAAVAGLAAENMVRGGGRLFMDFGRRIERAQAIVSQVALVLEPPDAGIQPGKVEAALRLALELRDSVITYRTRYLSVLQPAPALDLILADDGNPRGLAFQLRAIRNLLREIVEDGDSLLATVDPLTQEVAAIIRDTLQARDQMVTATTLPPRLRAIEAEIAALSDRVSRRYFALLPIARSLGMEDDRKRGAA